MYLHSWARVKVGSPNPVGTCHPCLADVSTDRFIVWPTSTYLNKNGNEITVNGTELVRTIPFNNDFVVDSWFDCKVVLSDIHSESLTVKSNLLKVDQDKTHSNLSQRSTEKLFLETLKRKNHKVLSCGIN